MTNEERNQVIEEMAKVAESFQEYPVHRPGCFEVAEAIRAQKKGDTCVCKHSKSVHTAQGCTACLEEDPEGDICYCFEDSETATEDDLKELNV